MIMKLIYWCLLLLKLLVTTAPTGLCFRDLPWMDRQIMGIFLSNTLYSANAKVI